MKRSSVEIKYGYLISFRIMTPVQEEAIFWGVLFLFHLAAALSLLLRAVLWRRCSAAWPTLFSLQFAFPSLCNFLAAGMLRAFPRASRSHRDTSAPTRHLPWAQSLGARSQRAGIHMGILCSVPHCKQYLTPQPCCPGFSPTVSIDLGKTII